MEKLQKAILLLESLRRPLLRVGIVVLLFSSVGYLLAKPLVRSMCKLTGVKLVAYGVPEIFLAQLSVALAFAVFVSVPYIAYTLLSVIRPFSPSFSRKTMAVFLFSSILLFYTGAFFCLRIPLPYGIKFLLGFETQAIRPLISVRSFVTFCVLFTFGFGIIFQLPLFIVFLGRLGLVDVRTLTGYRRYAILGTAVVSAILTPTPDAVNMMFMAVPLYLLFEIGILGLRLWGK